VYRGPGGRVSATFTRQAEAKAWLAAQTTDRLRGTLIDPRGADVLLRDWVAEWQRSRPDIRPGAAAAEQSRLTNHVLPAFGDRRLGAITASAVRHWVATLPLSAKTVRHCHGTLSTVMGAAVEEGLIARNPCLGTRLPEIVREEPVFLTETQVGDLVAACPPRWQPFVLTLAGTGLRWGEAVGLRVGRVDLARGCLRVEEQWSRYGWGPPKTRYSRRTVSLPGSVVDALGPLVAGREPGAPVFTADHGGMVQRNVFLRREHRPGRRELLGVWWQAVDDAGLAARRPTPHDLRHTHVALLIAAGVPLTAIQRRLGHSSITVTSDVYGHLLPAVDRQLLSALDTALDPSPRLHVV
jgi:integrase